MYKDEATNSLWLGINPRGAYIDLQRISDGFTLKNVHSVGHQVISPGYYQSDYRNKTSHVKFKHKSVFRKTANPNPAD